MTVEKTGGDSSKAMEPAMAVNILKDIKEKLKVVVLESHN